jgi:hypothetical protein
MAQPINIYMTGDDYSPVFLNPSLQQYDNYCIYDISCVDITVDRTNYDASHTIIINNKTSFLAVQAYNPSLIQCDFNSIMNQYK